MSAALRAALSDPRLAILAGPRLGAIDEPSPDDILLLLAQVGGLAMPEVDRVRVAWNTGDRARADGAHDLFVAGAAAKGVDPLAADRLWDALEGAWRG